ncbi:SE1832 family protein [Planococcus lenghuensis]|uniref:Uncharacterized protein n=1 Tax=Planococcus lenghuensis TaxID=2213202 RepID=A0A1Q2L2R2_9BACL|nr:hypothetical protein B0X71_15445 [Planococcus lenghuensis]
MTRQELEREITELKNDYIRQQGDIEKLESTGHGQMVEKAEARLEAMENRLAELNRQLANL